MSESSSSQQTEDGPDEHELKATDDEDMNPPILSPQILVDGDVTDKTRDCELDEVLSPPQLNTSSDVGAASNKKWHPSKDAKFSLGDDEQHQNKGTGKEYQFQLKQCHVLKNKQGRKLYRCDVCTGTYRHAFSLKRHFLRNHINYRYLSEADIANCSINLSIANHCLNTGKDSTGSIQSRKLPCKDSVGQHQGYGNSKVKGSTSLPDKHLVSDDSLRGSFPGLFRCHLCHQLFDVQNDLKQHITNHPDLPAQKRFSCHQCDMNFSHKQNLVRHLSVHSGEKPYPCKYCGKRFPTPTNQKRHERIHVGMKPYPCIHCTSVFTQSGDLRKHIRKQHQTLYHPCAFCSKYFSSEDSLKNHMEQHHKELLHTNKKLVSKRKKVSYISKPSSKKEIQSVGDSWSDFKFSCTSCRKRFTTYVNMCRHRRLAHTASVSKRLKTSSRQSGSNSTPILGLHKTNGSSSAMSEAEFFMTVAERIADNLVNHLDGKYSDIKSQRPQNHNLHQHEKVDGVNTVIWHKYNFPPDFNPATAGEEADTAKSCDYFSLKDGTKAEMQSTMGLMAVEESKFPLNLSRKASHSDDGYFPTSADLSLSFTKEKDWHSRRKLIGRITPVTYVCCVCAEQFNSDEAIENHKINNHPNVFCTHIEIEGEEIPPDICRHCCSPNGILNSCPVPPATSGNSSLTCTRCQGIFYSVTDLHLHIVQCGGHLDFTRTAKRRTCILRRKGRLSRKSRKDIQDMPLVKRQSNNTWSVTSKLHKPHFVKVIGSLEKSKQLPKENLNQCLQTRAKKSFTKQSSLAVSQNKINGHQGSLVSCKSCGRTFSYLAAFQKHSRECPQKLSITCSTAHKDKTKDPQVERKHYVCKYCKCVFLYPSSLRKHIKELCHGKGKVKNMLENSSAVESIEESTVTINANTNQQLHIADPEKPRAVQSLKETSHCKQMCSMVVDQSSKSNSAMKDHSKEHLDQAVDSDNISNLHMTANKKESLEVQFRMTGAEEARVRTIEEKNSIKEQVVNSISVALCEWILPKEAVTVNHVENFPKKSIIAPLKDDVLCTTRPETASVHPSDSSIAETVPALEVNGSENTLDNIAEINSTTENMQQENDEKRHGSEMALEYISTFEDDSSTERSGIALSGEVKSLPVTGCVDATSAIIHADPITKDVIQERASSTNVERAKENAEETEEPTTMALDQEANKVLAEAKPFLKVADCVGKSLSLKSLEMDQETLGLVPATQPAHIFLDSSFSTESNRHDVDRCQELDASVTLSESLLPVQRQPRLSCGEDGTILSKESRCPFCSVDFKYLGNYRRHLQSKCHMKEFLDKKKQTERGNKEHVLGQVVGSTDPLKGEAGKCKGSIGALGANSCIAKKPNMDKMDNTEELEDIEAKSVVSKCLETLSSNCHKLTDEEKDGTEQQRKDGGKKEKSEQFKIRLDPSLAIPNAAPALYIRGEVEHSLIDLMRDQTKQQEIIKSIADSQGVACSSSGFKTFSCDTCHKIFFSFFNMLRHRLTHKLEVREPKLEEEFFASLHGESSSDLESQMLPSHEPHEITCTELESDTKDVKVKIDPVDHINISDATKVENDKDKAVLCKLLLESEAGVPNQLSSSFTTEKSRPSLNAASADKVVEKVSLQPDSICTFCGKSFPCSMFLTRHYRLEHNSKFDQSYIVDPFVSMEDSQAVTRSDPQAEMKEKRLKSRISATKPCGFPIMGQKCSKRIFQAVVKKNAVASTKRKDDNIGRWTPIKRARRMKNREDTSGR